MDKKSLLAMEAKDDHDLDDSDLKQPDTETPQMGLAASPSFDISMFENDDLSLPKGKFIRPRSFV